MDTETRLQALEIVTGACVAILRDERPGAVAAACELLQRTLRGESALSTFPGEDQRPSPFGLERALALLRGKPLATGQA
jgi:hypothetical protein